MFERKEIETNFDDGMTNVEIGGQRTRGASAALGEPVGEEEVVGRVDLLREVALGHARVRNVGDVRQVIHYGLWKPGIEHLNSFSSESEW